MDPHPAIAMVTRVTVARIEQSLLFIYYDFFALGKRLLGLGVRVPPLSPSANALLGEKNRSDSLQETSLGKCREPASW
jgi:hypothetical protein